MPKRVYPFSGQKLPPALIEARDVHRERARKWTEHQAQRLGVSADEILTAIRTLAWLPHEIEALNDAGALREKPSAIPAASVPWWLRERRRLSVAKGERMKKEMREAA